MSGLYDKRGIPIEIGDVVKVFHFIAARGRKRNYMYKQAVSLRPLKDGSGDMMRFSHLNMTPEHYWEIRDGRVLAYCEIVQSIHCDHEERPRAEVPKCTTE
jgi:hypothetical protein